MRSVDTTQLERIFANVNLPGPFSNFEDLLVRDGNRRILGPYLPFIGSLYKKYRVLFYAISQNLSDQATLVESYCNHQEESLNRLQYKWRDSSPKRSITDEEIYENCEMGPIAGGVIPALASIYLKAKHNENIENPIEAMSHFAFTNFYKLSFVDRIQEKYVNPNNLGERGRLYTELTFEHYVAEELKTLQPKVVISCKGISFDLLKNKLEEKYFDNPFELIGINDTSWILRGNNGFLKQGGNWDKNIPQEIRSLLVSLTNPAQFRHGYKDRQDEIRRYLNHYYAEFIS